MPFAVLLVGILGALFAFLAAVLISSGYRYTLGALLIKLAEALNHVPIVGGTISGYVHEIDNYVRQELGQAVLGTQHAWHAVCQWTAYAFNHPAAVLGDVAEATEHAFQFVRHHTIPFLIGVANTPLGLAVGLFHKQIAHLLGQVAAILAHPIRLIKTVATTVTHLTHTVTHVVYRTIPATVAHAVAIPWGAIHSLERRETAIEKWIRAHRAKVEAVSVGAVAAIVLSRLGLGWTRCSNVGKVGKAICGLDTNLLESLLVDALAIASTISIVELAKSCQSFESDVETPLRFFVRELQKINPAPGPSGGAALAAYIAGDF